MGTVHRNFEPPVASSKDRRTYTDPAEQNPARLLREDSAKKCNEMYNYGNI